MVKDPIVKEVHNARQKIYKECSSDMRKVVEYLRKKQKEHADRIVTKKQVLKKQAATA